MLAKRGKYSLKVQRLKEKFQKLPVGKNRSYMQFRHARMKAGLLANDFAMQTLERPATVHRLIMNRRLKTVSPVPCCPPKPLSPVPPQHLNPKVLRFVRDVMCSVISDPFFRL